jgi:hypothetical protein
VIKTSTYVGSTIGLSVRFAFTYSLPVSAQADKHIETAGDEKIHRMKIQRINNLPCFGNEINVIYSRYKSSQIWTGATKYNSRKTVPLRLDVAV